MYIEVYFVPSAEPVSQATLETESQLVDTVGAGVISGSAGVLNPNNGADQEFATDRKSTRLNSSHVKRSRMPSSA